MELHTHENYLEEFTYVPLTEQCETTSKPHREECTTQEGNI